MVCTFFGHRNVNASVKSILKNVIRDLIEKENATAFYIGNQGDFDFLAKSVIGELKKDYPHINYNIVLAYLPTKKDNDNYIDCSATIYPEGLENVPPKFAIDKRNRWLVEHSDTVITYVTHNFGGAAKFKELAISKKKKIIEISNLSN